MRTTVTIDDKKARALMAIYRTQTLPKAIRSAINEYLQIKSRAKLLTLFGKVDLDIDLKKLRRWESK